MYSSPAVEIQAPRRFVGLFAVAVLVVGKITHYLFPVQLILFGRPPRFPRPDGSSPVPPPAPLRSQGIGRKLQLHTGF